MENKFTAIILAAGMGTRMKSNLPKPAHKACGKALINWVSDAAKKAGAEKIIAVVGHGKEEIEKIAREGTVFAEQKNMLGTGDAVSSALPFVEPGYTVILCGDTPIITAETIKGALNETVEKGLDALVLTADAEDPTGYGRIIKENGLVKKIVEEKNCSPEEKKITEINSGMFVFKSDALLSSVPKIEKNEVSGEYYFTDTVEILVSKGKKVGSYKIADFDEIMGVNDRVALSKADAVLRKRINYDLMYSGVTIIDPERTYIEDGVKIGRDSVVLPGTVLEGDTVIGAGCVIGPDTKLKNTIIGDGTEVVKSVGLDCVVGENTTVGPFAYLRPDTKVGNHCRIGDFVELKNSTIGDGTKVSHLTYVGDSDVGERVNFGCGTVTVNYDGAKKYRTTIGNDVFVGCNSNLVAPVTLSDGAYTAAGSTITDDVPESTLAIARARQVNKDKWNDRRKNKK